MDELACRLVEKAVEVAGLLNTVDDDDEREQLQELYERRLNDELFHGSEIRAANVEYPRIQPGARVRRSDGSEGTVLGFHERRARTPSPRSRGSSRRVLVDTDYGTEASWPLADLTVIEQVFQGGTR